MDYVLSQAHHGYQHNEGGHKADAVNVSTFLCSHIFLSLVLYAPLHGIYSYLDFMITPTSQ